MKNLLLMTGPLQKFLIYFFTYFISWRLGIDVARTFDRRQEAFARLLLQLATIIGAVFFLLMRPETDITSMAALKNQFLVLGAFALAGIVCYFIFRRYKMPSSLTAWDKNGLKILILFLVLVSLPILLKPVFQWWDASGWMDSQGYDSIAHGIATGQTPQGSSYFMPLYQYGMAFIYFIFGHFFYVQQIVNVLMGISTIILLCLSAWNIFRNKWAVFAIGIMAVFTTQLHHALFYTQIENWYVPAVCLVIFAWSCYWRRSVLSHVVFLAVSVGLALNMRTQGALFLLFLFFTPVFIESMRFRTRLGHIFAIIIVSGMTLLPWSIRNYVVEHRFTPSSDQAVIQMCLLNDRRVGFYGIRYDIGYREASEDYVKKYPDAKERLDVMKRDAYKNIFGDPAWLTSAIRWRSLAFYGLLPPGVWVPAGPQATNWKADWQGYLYWGYPYLFYILVAFAGFISRISRMTLFLILGILANLSIVIFAGFGEPRLCYPVLPLHMLLGLCIFFSPSPQFPQNDWSLVHMLFSGKKKIYWACGLVSLAILLSLIHFHMGVPNLHRPLMENTMVIDDKIMINRDLPSLNKYFAWKVQKTGTMPKFNDGEKVRLVIKLSNYMFPPKYAGNVSIIKLEAAKDPAREVYYYAYPPEGGLLGVTYLGAVEKDKVREDDTVEIEGTILLINPDGLWPPDFWIKAEKIAPLPKR